MPMAMMAGESVVPANRGRGQLRLREALRHPASAVVPIIIGRDVIAQAQSGTGKTSMIGLTVCQIVVLISATLPNEILVITSKFLTDLVMILVKRDDLNLEATSLLLFIFLLSKAYIPCLGQFPCSFNLHVHSTVSFHPVDQGTYWLLKLSGHLVDWLTEKMRSNNFTGLFYAWRYVLEGERCDNERVPGCVGEDIRGLESGVLVLSGTSGRFCDMIKRRTWQTRAIKMLVLVVLISATLPNEILEMTSKFMIGPVRILVKSDELTLEGIKQFFVAVEREVWKFDILCDLYDTLSITQAVIFCNA
ncbi:hypothetical protein RHSIM_Rhsim13G0156500 [Rhododendron simsii]|uniref:Uncharacterized protein n=1 Tax=Rhododendron simsii TaxID=118357 RepID=A0A834FZU7_RHOSS|nr:hypothetical protein RHSIM_Rhsim13G0156500 [Rhododendron simsii]